MLFNSIFQNVNVTLLCITNSPTMLYAACPEKWGGRGVGGGGVGGLGLLFLNFLDPPLRSLHKWKEETKLEGRGCRVTN